MRCCACMETCKTRDTCTQRLHWHFVVCHFWRTGVYEHRDIQAHTHTLHTQRFRNTRPAYRLRVGGEDYVIHKTYIMDYRIRQKDRQRRYYKRHRENVIILLQRDAETLQGTAGCNWRDHDKPRADAWHAPVTVDNDQRVTFSHCQMCGPP